MACYQYRRRRGLAMPPKMASVIYRSKVTDTRSDIAQSAWDRFR